MIIRHVSASGGSYFASFSPPPPTRPPKKALSLSSIFQRAQLHPLSRPPPLQNISLCKKKFLWMINKSSSTEKKKKNHLIQLWMDLSCECSWAFVGSLNPPSLCHESIVRRSVSENKTAAASGMNNTASNASWNIHRLPRLCSTSSSVIHTCFVCRRERERGGIKSEDVEALVDAEAKANQM